MNTGMNMRRKVFLAITLLCMAAIFLFSSRTGAESTGDSYFVGNIVGEVFVPGFDKWSPEEQQAFAEKIDHPVRKTAHAMEYAVLGASDSRCVYRQADKHPCGDPGPVVHSHGLCRIG